jgi:quercetin dioxygenase-like cupin family protein
MKLIWLVAGLFALFISPTPAQEPKDVTVTQLLSTTVTRTVIVLPRKNAQIVVSTYDIAPGATLPVHKHSYPRYGYVLTGRLCVTNMETGQSDIYEPGDFILESVGQWHMGTNIGGEALKLMVIGYGRKRPDKHAAARVIRPLANDYFTQRCGEDQFRHGADQ